jgi:enoyl-CoA hydratase/carnithine racemase
MSTDPVAIHRKGQVGLLSLQDGRPLEALAQPLVDALGVLAEDDGIRVIVLEVSGLQPETYQAVPVVAGTRASTCAAEVAAMTKPLVAALRGDCLDGALELALACDIRVADRAARFGMRHVRNGVLPADGGTQRLTRLVGRGHALRLLLTGDRIDAEEALRIGLVQRLGGLSDAMAAAEGIAAAGPIASAYAKEAVQEGADLPLAQALRLEADLSFLLQSTADRAEGLRSFRERRPPQYEGR